MNTQTLNTSVGEPADHVSVNFWETRGQHRLLLQGNRFRVYPSRRTATHDP